MANVLPAKANYPAQVGPLGFPDGRPRSPYAQAGGGPRLMQPWRDAYRRQQGGFGQAHIICYGDSVTSGYNSTLHHRDGWVGHLSRRMTAHTGQPNGTGIIHATEGLDGGDTRLTYNGTWVAGTLYGFYNSGAYTIGADNMTMTDQPCEAFRIFYAQETVGAGGSQFTVAVDGGDPVAIDAQAAPAVKTYTTPTTTDGLHTLVVTETDGTLNLFGIEAIRNPSRGIKTSQIGRGSAMVSTMLLNTLFFNSRNCLLATDPDLSILMFGLNDAFNGVSYDTFVTNLNTVIDLWTAKNSAIMLVISAPPTVTSPANDDWERYVSAMYRVADARGCGIVDLTAKWGTRDNMVRYYSDTVHLNDAGHELIGNTVADAVIAYSTP